MLKCTSASLVHRCRVSECGTESASSLFLKRLSNSLVRWLNFRLNFMHGDCGAGWEWLLLDVHKAIPRVSTEIVDRRRCKYALSSDDVPLLAMDS
jgi:hypothetical protein